MDIWIVDQWRHGKRVDVGIQRAQIAQSIFIHVTICLEAAGERLEITDEVWAPEPHRLPQH